MSTLRAAVTSSWTIGSRHRFVMRVASIPMYSQRMNLSRENAPVPERLLMKDARMIFDEAVNSVMPMNLVKNSLALDGDLLHVGNRTFDIKNGVYVVGFGKAVLGMVKATEDVLGDRIVEGIASVPCGIADSLVAVGKSDMIPSTDCKVKIMEGAANNSPDDSAFKAAKSIEALLEKRKEGDFILTLISGGGSALLPYPTPPITLEEMATVTRLLSRKGASIQQLNSVRKHLEVLKGGGLAKTADPAEMVSLMISDVVGDDLDCIASGPTVPDLYSPEQSLQLIQQMGLDSQMPASILSTLRSKEISFRATFGEGQGSGFPRDKVHNVLLGTNQIALDAAKLKAERLGYIPVILTHTLDTNVKEATVMFTKLMRFMAEKLFDSRCLLDSDLFQTFSHIELDLVSCGINKPQINEIISAITQGKNSGTPICILAGGETTVDVVDESGFGGRSQQMALDFAINLNKFIDSKHLDFSPVFLSAGTDGQDGPNGAAGAVVDSLTVPLALAEGLSPEQYTQSNDSYTFFSKLNKGSYHIVTGLTGTNVMDIQVILLHPNQV